MIYNVYWIRSDEHTDQATQGYVGCSTNVEERIKQHRSRNTIPVVRDYLRSCAENQVAPKVSILATFEDKDDAYAFEKSLRPEKDIGWNTTVGGNGGQFLLKEQSDEAKKAIGDANRGRVKSEKAKEMIGGANRGRVWWTDGVTNKSLYPTEDGPTGWRRGRAHKSKPTEALPMSIQSGADRDYVEIATNHLLSSLDERDRRVVSMKFGIGGNALTFEKIGEKLGISTSAAHRDYHAGMAGIKKAIDASPQLAEVLKGILSPKGNTRQFEDLSYFEDCHRYELVKEVG